MTQSSEHRQSGRSVIVLWGGKQQDVPFERGDANSDSSIDISDAIVNLGHQFLGVPSDLGCEKAADFDDSGELDVTDPIAILAHLFLAGGQRPAAPFGGCGRDPTRDRLECLSYPPCQ